MVSPRSELLPALGAVLAGRPGHGALEVHYQPVVAVADGSPLGAEALVRWRHPQLGLLAPDAFVPLAEHAGLGGRLDAHVLETALGQLAAWDTEGQWLHRVGVNLGRTSLHSPALVDTVLRACDRTGTPPDRLMVEVLEHEELDLTAARLAAVQTLADADTTVAIDDFGAGHAGVGLLGRLPVGVLKLDRSLLPGSPRTAAAGAPDPRAVLEGVVALAAAVGVEVTAEGVETAGQREVLARLGVPHAQGWLYARAMPAAAFASWWQDRVAATATAASATAAAVG
jgi:EAL domain-containing protein (putative c-di-GMP-specific phosphodiesterase class I)